MKERGAATLLEHSPGNPQGVELGYLRYSQAVPVKKLSLLWELSG